MDQRTDKSSYRVAYSCLKNKPNWNNKAVSALEAISNVTAPAQKHATDDAVYTALFNCTAVSKINLARMMLTIDNSRTFGFKLV